MIKYIRIARPDHWIKQLFVFPGSLFALLLVQEINIDADMLIRLILGL